MLTFGFPLSSSVKKTPIQSFIELSRSNEVSPQRLEEELSKVLEGESVDAAITSPIFNEWLSKIGIRDAINTPVRLELKHLKCTFVRVPSELLVCLLTLLLVLVFQQVLHTRMST